MTTGNGLVASEGASVAVTEVGEMATNEGVRETEPAPVGAGSVVDDHLDDHAAAVTGDSN